MENEPSAITKVEELKNFPFKSFQELKKAWQERTVTINLNTVLAHEFAFRGKAFSRTVTALTRISESTLILSPIGFVLYVVLNRTWLLLSALPLLIIALFAFNPDTPKTVRRGLFGLTCAAFIWSIIAIQPGLTVLALSLLIV